MRKVFCLAISISCLTMGFGQKPALRTFTTVPQGFEPNRGQAAQGVDFTSHGPGYALSLTPAAAYLQMFSAARPDRAKESSTLSLTLVGADPKARVEGLERQAGRSNYFLGNKSNRWLTDIPQFARVEYHGVYPGIDIAYYGTNQRLEYDFILAPHADPRSIRLAVNGANRIRIDADGDLVFKVGSTEIRERKPAIFQRTASGRSVVKGRFVALAGNQIGFALESYNANRELVIDPVLVFSTFFGGSGADNANGIALDRDGNAYIAGKTGSANLAGKDIGSPSFADSGTAAFVAKISPSGALIFNTIIAGAGDQAEAGAIAVYNGNIYLAGYTASATFPTANPLQAGYAGGGDAFVLELNHAGNALIYSTYLGGGGLDYADGIAVDSKGNTLVGGATTSENFPVLNAAQSKQAGGYNPWAAKIAPGGWHLVYSTYWGGSDKDYSNGLAVDSQGNLILFGDESSMDFPVTDHAYQPKYCVLASGEPVSTVHGWVAKFGPSGVPVFSTYICGTVTYAGSPPYPPTDAVRGGTVDSAGDAILTGVTASSAFPTLNPVQAQLGSDYDAFLIKLSPSGTLLYSTYLGGPADSYGWGVALDELENIYVAGETKADFPTVNPTQSQYGGGSRDGDAFLMKINAAGSDIVFATYIGGSGEDYATSVAVDEFGNAFVAGSTASYDFPVKSALQANYGGGTDDAFLTKISTCDDSFISPAEFGRAGGMGSIAVATTQECGWTATSNSSWITVGSSPASGAGAGSVSISAAANMGATRVGSLSIGGRIVYIAQYGFPVLRVAESNAASFTQGQKGATYTVIAGNRATGGPTSGAVTLTQTLPAGLKLVSMAGPGWSCSGAVCKRSDALNPASSYPAVTVTVNVAANAATPLLAKVSLSGGGSPAAVTGTDSTAILPPPVLSVAETNSASFKQGQKGAIYTVTVGNRAGAGPTNGKVTLQQTVPQGLTLVSMSGRGWTCSGASCTRSDMLSPGDSYPPVTVKVNVAANAPASVTSVVSASGGCGATVTASDNTKIVAK